jgi:hypothetical protein
VLTTIKIIFSVKSFLKVKPSLISGLEKLHLLAIERIAPTSNASAGSALIACSSSLVSLATLQISQKLFQIHCCTCQAKLKNGSKKRRKQAYHSNVVFFIGYARQNSSKNVSIVWNKLVPTKFDKLIYLLKPKQTLFDKNNEQQNSNR